MEENRNNRAIERRLKECLRHDRARIQVGRISHFGLLEMSRQRIRTSVLESSTEKCPYCGGSGHVRSVSSLALQVLRALEEQLMKAATHNLTARTRRDVAEYVLNHKRAHLRALEERFAITIMVIADETVTAPQAFVIDRGELVHSVEAARAIAEQNQAAAAAAPLEEEDDLEDESIVEEVERESLAEEVEEEGLEMEAPSIEPEHGEDGPPRRRRRRGRGGRGRGDEPRRREQIPIHEEGAEPAGEHFAPADDEATAGNDATEPHSELADGERDERPDNHGERPEPQHDGERRRRRRGRRGGRRNRHERNGNDLHGNDHGNDRGPRCRNTISPRAKSPRRHSRSSPKRKTRSPTSMLRRHLPNPRRRLSKRRRQSRRQPRRRSTVREPAPVSHSESAPPSVPARRQHPRLRPNRSSKPVRPKMPAGRAKPDGGRAVSAAVDRAFQPAERAP